MVRQIIKSCEIVWTSTEHRLGIQIWGRLWILNATIFCHSGSSRSRHCWSMTTARMDRRPASPATNIINIPLDKEKAPPTGESPRGRPKGKENNSPSLTLPPILLIFSSFPSSYSCFRSSKGSISLPHSSSHGGRKLDSWSPSGVNQPIQRDSTYQ